MSVPNESTGPAARSQHFRTRMLGVLRVVIVSLPTPIGYWLCDRAGDLLMRFAAKSRQAAIINMTHALGPASRDELRRTVRGVFHNLMRSYFDLAVAPSLSDKKIDSLIDFDEVGWKRVTELYNQGRSIILVSGHYGAFDEITQVISRRGLPVTVLVATVKPAWLSDFIMQLRQARGLPFLLVNDEEGSGVNLTALKQSLKILRSNQLLGVVADRNTEARGVSIQFLGGEAVVASGVAKMALRTKAAVVTSFCTRLPNHRYQVVFDPPIEPQGSASNEADLRRLLTQIFSRYEHYIRRHPDQWVLLQPVWKERRRSKT